MPERAQLSNVNTHASSFFFFVTLEPGVERYTSLSAVNASPPRDRASAQRTHARMCATANTRASPFNALTKCARLSIQARQHSTHPHYRGTSHEKQPPPRTLQEDYV